MAQSRASDSASPAVQTASHKENAPGICMSAALEPTRRDERIGMLDTTRGIAVLGILLLNIAGFGLPYAYDDPTNWGGHEGANLAAWRTNALFFEGTMRGLFTLLFGAGALLFLERHAAHSSNLRPADLYFRRTLWLIVFGLVNGYVLLWDGDILYYYGVVGLLLFVFRKLPARRLILISAVIISLQAGVSAAERSGYFEIRNAAQTAEAQRVAGEPLTEEQEAAIEQFRELRAEFKPSRATLERMIADVRESYASAFAVIAERTWYVQTVFFFAHGLGESLAMMLFGMALFKLGVLTGAASTRVYLTLVVAGYAIGLGVNLSEVSRFEGSGFSTDALMNAYLTYDLGRIPMTLGHIGLIGLLCRAGTLPRVTRILAAVGQMALTNYLTQSVICMFLFTGAGFALYGQLERHELYYVVAAIWIVQLIWSPLWLHHYRFGPAEWLWRSLTYWQKQPMRRAIADPAQQMPAQQMPAPV